MHAPPSADLLWTTAQHAFQSGDFPAAQRACQAVLQRDAQHSGAHFLLSNIFTNHGQHRMATTHALAAAARMGPQSLQHVAAVALKLISVGEYESAARLVRKINPAAVPFTWRWPETIPKSSGFDISMIQRHLQT